MVRSVRHADGRPLGALLFGGGGGVYLQGVDEVTVARTEGEALVYMIDCTLATVAHMAYLKSRPPGEFKRQIAIAQRGLRWAMDFGSPLSSRPKEVAEQFGGNVTAWAEDILARKKP